jgi:hypothetical protein
MIRAAKLVLCCLQLAGYLPLSSFSSYSLDSFWLADADLLRKKNSAE